MSTNLQMSVVGWKSPSMFITDKSQQHLQSEAQ